MVFVRGMQLLYGERVPWGRRCGTVKQISSRGTYSCPGMQLSWRSETSFGVCDFPSSTGGASPWFSCAERNFLTESESFGVAGAACGGHRKADLVERNASVVLRAGLVQIRGAPCRHVGIAPWGLGLGCTSKIGLARPPLEPLGVY